MRRALNITAAAILLLDCSEYESFLIYFRTSVETLELRKIIPGVLYTFTLTQDGIGGHQLNWGSTARNATPLNPTPNSTTVQSFIGMAGGYLQAVPPGTWS